MAQWTSRSVHDTIARLGARVLEWTSAEFGRQPGPAWDMLIGTQHTINYISAERCHT